MPILDVTLIVSLLVRRVRLNSIEISRPVSWKLIVAVAICGILLQVKDIVTETLARLLWQEHKKVSSVISSVHHSPSMLLNSLVIVWTFAAIGEEFAYRALLLHRTADALNGSRLAYTTATIVFQYPVRLRAFL